MALTKLGKFLLNLRSTSFKMRPFNVVVEGNIGSGKTTFLEYFKRYENVCVLAEPVDKWRSCNGHNLLGLMYDDINKWSFTFQSYVMLSMVENHTLPTDCTIKLMERSIYSARYCFIEKMMQDKFIPKPSGAVLDEWFAWFKENTALDVDLIVYLRTSPEVVYERMRERNRDEEKCVSLEYLKDLHEIHEKWLYHKTLGECPAPVIVLNADLDRSVITREYEKYEPAILNKIQLST